MAQKVDEEKKKAGDVQDELSHEREKRLHLETELQKVMNGNYIGQHATVPVTTDPTTGPASAKESSTSSSPAVVAPLPEGHIPLSELERHISFVKVSPFFTFFSLPSVLVLLISLTPHMS